MNESNVSIQPSNHTFANLWPQVVALWQKFVVVVVAAVVKGQIWSIGEQIQSPSLSLSSQNILVIIERKIHPDPSINAHTFTHSTLPHLVLIYLSRSLTFYPTPSSQKKIQQQQRQLQHIYAQSEIEVCLSCCKTTGKYKRSIESSREKRERERERQTD